MMSPTPHGQPEFGDARPRDAFDNGTSGDSDSKFLDQILETTREAVDGDTSITPQELECLLDVARRHRQKELCLEPVLVELVQAILLANYGHLQRDSQFWEQTSTKMAVVLYESPATLPRLQNLWHRLQEANR